MDMICPLQNAQPLGAKLKAKALIVAMYSSMVLKIR
jgi:hypothetical protein